jgi:hypothetical protein
MSPQILNKIHYRNFIEIEILQYIVDVSTDTKGFADSKCPDIEILISA